jgi:hypothetical protein
VLADLAASGSNQNPVRMGNRMLLPRADADMIMPAAVFNHDRDNDDALLALSAVVTREGTISNIELLGTEDHVHDAALQRDSRELLQILDVASTARFEPARYEGVPVAVNMVWVLAHTTVRAKIPAVVEPWHVPPVTPAVTRPATKGPASDARIDAHPRGRHSYTPAVGV